MCIVKTLLNKFMIFLLVFCFLAGVVAYQVIHIDEPELQNTKLSDLQINTYLYSIKKLSDADEESPVGVSLSPEETSFLAEKIDFKFRKYGFQLVDLHLDNKGDDARIRSIWVGPLGFYYKLKFIGTVELRENNKKWVVDPNKLSTGPVPLGYVIWDEYSPEWSREMSNGLIRVEGMRLDGKGLRAKFSVFKLDMSHMFDL